jgi:hypothetical protein
MASNKLNAYNAMQIDFLAAYLVSEDFVVSDYDG